MKKETVIYTLYYSYQSGETQFDRKYKEFSSQFIDEIKQIAKVESPSQRFSLFCRKKDNYHRKSVSVFLETKNPLP